MLPLRGRREAGWPARAALPSVRPPHRRWPRRRRPGGRPGYV